MTTKITEQNGTLKTPPMILIYGDSGTGKTTDCAYSFPNALFIAVPNAVASAESVCGYLPNEIGANNITEANELIQKELKKKGKKPEAIVIDDISYLHQRELEMWADTDKGRKNQFYKYQMANTAVYNLRDTLRFAGVPVIMNAWMNLPKTRDGVFMKGGPKFTGTIGAALSAMCDVVLKAIVQPNRKPWKGAYQCALDNQWILKDRFNVAIRLGTSPMNIGELLRASGFEVSRLSELDWQEGMVEQIATGLIEQTPAKNFNDYASACYSQLLEKGINDRHAAWTVRDAMDRAVIRRGLAARRASFF